MADHSGTPSGEELQLRPVTPGPLNRRPAMWGALAAAALVAGALVVASNGGDTHGRLPVSLGAPSGDEGAAGASMLAWIHYVAGDGLPRIGGDAPAYRVRGGIDEARVVALARALGMNGAPERSEGRWRLESDDGAVLDVDETSGGTWWYGAPGGAVAIAEGPAAQECPPNLGCVSVQVTPTEPCPPDADCVAPAPLPVEPQPPLELPTEAEARRIALDLLVSSGWT